MQFSVFSNDWLSCICLNEDPHMDQLFTELLKRGEELHGESWFSCEVTATDLLLLRSLGRLFSYKKFISSLSARSFCSNVILTLFEGNPTYV